MPISSDSFHVSDGGREAHLKVDNLPMPDTFFFANNASVAGQIGVDVTWKATAAPVTRGFGTTVPAADPGAFIGEFSDASCEGVASGAETGFWFETGTLTADNFFAEMGPERNGVFLTETPPAESLMYGTNANRSGGAPLEGATISGKVYVWMSPLRPDDVDSINNVDFSIDGKFRHRERRAPYDMISGGDDAATASWNSRDVSNGRTTVTATVVSDGGSTREVEATFRVAN